jgi:Ni,Fe-hydrogenase I cytochrome b subunit
MESLESKSTINYTFILGGLLLIGFGLATVFVSDIFYHSYNLFFRKRRSRMLLSRVMSLRRQTNQRKKRNNLKK